MKLVAICGLQREAKIVGGPGVAAVAGGGDATALAERIAAAAEGCSGLISIGVAGGLDPALAVGEAVVASEIIADGALLAVDPRWAGRIAGLMPAAKVGRIAGGDAIVGDAGAKAALRAASGALAVDMESHIAARTALRLGLPFAALRFISDGASDAMPPAALAAMRPDGGIAMGAILASLARNLGQLPALMRLGRDSETAFRALGRGRDLLGPTLGFPEVEGL